MSLLSCVTFNALLLPLLGAPCSLSSTPQPISTPPGDSTLLCRVSGRTLGNGQWLLSVEPGPVATRAIRIYSEPSHTRLFYVMDSHFKATPEGAAWLAGIAPDKVFPGMVVLGSTTQLPDGSPSAQLPARPAGDDRISVWVYGNYPSGLVQDNLVAEDIVSSSDFGFAAYVNPMTDYIHCCLCLDGYQICVQCSSKIFNCCVTSDLCGIYCPPELCPPP